uniref:Albumin 1 n=1 Tax=Quercus lobata TaxID=97700 RepID=A0A7N2LP55_QUELO
MRRIVEMVLVLFVPVLVLASNPSLLVETRPTHECKIRCSDAACLGKTPPKGTTSCVLFCVASLSDVKHNHILHCAESMPKSFESEAKKAEDYMDTCFNSGKKKKKHN